MVQHQELLVLLGNGRSDGTSSDKVGEVLENVQRGRRHLFGGCKLNCVSKEKK